MNKQEAAEKYVDSLPHKEFLVFSGAEERCYVAGWDAAIEAAAKVVHEVQDPHDLWCEIRKLAE